MNNTKAQPLPPLHEGISRVLSRWTALQMAVRNQWGGTDSLQKSQQLALHILSWFSQSQDQPTSVQVEDLENLLHESLLLSFNTDIEDGSIEEVAEQLFMIHEEIQNGNRVSFQLKSNPVMNLKLTRWG